jgi:hypothetical protein
MLADIYSWFKEGFESADLKDVRALLDELRAQTLPCTEHIEADYGSNS